MPASNVAVTANYIQSTVQVQFRYSGLSSLNTITVLTIDGVEYQFNSWELTSRSYQMPIGSTLTIAATPTLTGYDGVTHYFSSWTNGNGLSTASGTFTVPNTDVILTVNYGLTQPPTTSATTLTVSCSVDSVDKGNPITVCRHPNQHRCRRHRKNHHPNILQRNDLVPYRFTYNICRRRLHLQLDSTSRISERRLPR